MSSFVRNIQRAAARKKYHQGRGSKLGYTNPKGRELVARQKREGVGG